jgi:MFS family permease
VTPPRTRPSLPLVVLVGTGGITSAVRWLELLAIGVFVFDRTGSAFMVTLMTMLRMLPMALFGVFGGAVADRLRRVPLLLGGLAGTGFVSIWLGYLAEHDEIAIWHVAVGSFLSGLVWSTDFSVRRTLLSDYVPAAGLPRVLTIDVLVNNSTRMLGPTLGGVLLQYVGLAGTYYFGALAHFLCLIGVLLLRLDAAPRAGGDSVLVSIIEGLRYLRGNRTLTGTLMITIIFNMFGWPFISLVPVIGRDVLDLSAAEIGLLMSAEGAGVILAAAALIAIGPSVHFRRIYFAGCASYTVWALVLANTGLVAVAVASMLLAGVGAACFATMQSTLTMLQSAPYARTRMMGVLAMCIGTSPLGLLHLGWMADLLGAPLALSIMALEGMLALLLCARIWPEVLAPQPPMNALVSR